MSNKNLKNNHSVIRQLTITLEIECVNGFSAAVALQHRYWLVHTGGVFPVKLKSKKKKGSVVPFPGQRESWKPWISTRRGFLIAICQISLILYNSNRWMARRSDDFGYLTWNLEFFMKLVLKSLTFAKMVVMICLILTATIRHKEIETLLNNVSTVYFDVFKSRDPPKARKFTFLIIYMIFTTVVSTATHLAMSFLATADFSQKFIWGAFYMYTMSYVEAIPNIVLIYLQSAIEGLNHEIKTRFPRVDEFDLRNWGPVVFRGEDRQQENAKYFLTECRSKYRSAAKIVGQLNSVYGFPKLIIVIFNQTACLGFAFCYLALLGKSISNSEAVNHRDMIYFGINCVRSFVRISMICHSHEIVLKEIQLTMCYVASIDASEIDQDSKIELLEFLEEIDGRQIRFTASNVFSLDHATCYLILTNTITYITIVIQHLLSQKKPDE